MDAEGEWPPEDDYDALNDETFGGEADGEEFTWDTAQSMLSDFESLKQPSKPNGTPKPKVQQPPPQLQRQENNAKPPPVRAALTLQELEESFEQEIVQAEAAAAAAEAAAAQALANASVNQLLEENDFDNENALEESISRLVMDEFDDDDEEEAMKSKLRRLGETGKSLNTYFMPPQVANRHLQWFVDKELPGGNSLFGPSVWSMHPTTTTGPQSNKSNDAQTPIGNQVNRTPISQPHPHDILLQGNNSLQQHQQQSHQPFAPQVPVRNDNVLGKLTDGRLQQQHHEVNVIPGPGLKPIVPSSQPSKKPVFKTVEELERELLEESEISIPNEFPVNHVPEPISTSTPNHRRVMTAEELERQLIESSSTSTPPMTPRSSSIQSPKGVLPQSPSAFTPQIHSPGIILDRSPRPQGMNLSGMMQHQRLPPHMVPPNSPGSFAQAQRMMAANAQLHQNPHHYAMAIHQQQQHHMRMMQMNPQLRGRMPFPGMPFPPMPPGHPMHRPGFPMMPGPGMMPHPNFFRQMDPYGGLMNEKDKQRLRNIAIIQLQNDHPYTTDYYSLMYKVRHGTCDPKRQRDYLSKLFPKKNDGSSNRNNYQPAHFENSLGKLQAVSALAPKKAIDTVIRVVDSGPSRNGMKAYRYLLLEIEKLYECLLKIQEADIRKTLLLNADNSTILSRQENELKVKNVLQPQAKLSEILSVQKGKMLVSRLIPLMDNTFKFYLLAHMVSTFPEWGLSQEIDRTYPFLRHCVFSADMQNIVCTFNSTIVRSIYETMLSTKLGISLLLAVFHRAENIIQSTISTDEKADYLNQLYLKEVQIIAQSMLNCAAELAVPIEIPPNLLQHFGRWGYDLDELLELQTVVRMWEKQSVPYIQ